jgi:archaellum component FlaC
MITLDRVIAFTAFCIAAAAAYFSVTGIGKLFAGAAISAMVMASALELGKLVSVSFLYRHWNVVPKFLKTYMSIGSVVLILITSAGIYGYLSSAYALVAATPLQTNALIQADEARKVTLEQEINRRNQRLDQIIQLRGQQENRIDDLISKSQTGNTTTIRTAQAQLRELDNTVQGVQKEVTTLSNTRDSLTQNIIQNQVAINTNSDIGTFMYVANFLGVSLDTVVKWFILIIVLVFDPLSISLVLAYNFLKIKEKENTLVIEENKIIEPPNIHTVYQNVAKEDMLPTEDLPITETAISNLPNNSDTLENLFNASLPYYMEAGFDWNKDIRWRTDPTAVNFKKFLDSNRR